MMNRLSDDTRPIWQVADLTRYLSDLIESDELLQDTWVRGEILNFSRPASGHLYFTLKDRQAALRCVMWRGQASRLTFLPRDGQAVMAHGSLGIYDSAGQYQLYADQLKPIGEGDLFRQYLELKERLEKEGLFAMERKRPIPGIPGRIGIVTSPTGAALQDMLNILRRRFPLVEVILAPTSVQGVDAPNGIISAISAINRLNCADVILLARGGGSIEDLWAFNNEDVARTIAESTIPIVCGIGHETDFTIADFVCDLRASTPTAAAELVSPDQNELKLQLTRNTYHLIENLRNRLFSLGRSLKVEEDRLNAFSPGRQIRMKKQSIDDLLRRLELGMRNHLGVRRVKTIAFGDRLSALNPLGVLRRGYSILYRRDGTIIHSANQVAAGEMINGQLADGKLQLRVTNSFSQLEDNP